MSRWPLLLLAVLACALGLVACGGDGDDDDVATILSDTFGEDKNVKSGNLNLSFRLDAQGLQDVQGPVALRLSGPFESTKPSELPKFDFNLELDAGGQAISAGAVSTGDKGFLRFAGQAYALSDELFGQFRTGYAEQARCDDGKDGGVSLRTLGVDPSRWLRDASKEGDDEEVGGAETTHVTAGIDVPRFLEDVNRILGRTTPQQLEDPCATGDEAQAEPKENAQDRRLSAEDRKTIAGAIKDARVDIWTGKDDRTLRRMNVALTFEVPESARERARGMTSGKVRFDMTIGALNEKQDVKAPADARPLEELIGQMGGQVPGLGSSSGSSEQGTSEQGSEYEQCLSDAGGDVRKLQDCGKLLKR